MHALEIQHGTLVMTELPLPTLKPGELLLRISHIGLNRADVLQREGRYPAPEGASPIPGLEASGTIAAIGEGVPHWQVGQQACALMAGGAYAQYAAVPATQLLPLPKNISLAEAAALPEAAATAWMALKREAALQPGERVLLHGGTSGLGLLLGQIARGLGAEVFATVGSDEKVAFLKPYGITAFNHRTTPFAPQVKDATRDEGVDVIIDTLGGPALSDHLSLLRRHGRMVTLAVMEGAMADGAKISRVLTHHLRWSGAMLRNRSAAEKAEIMAAVGKTVWPMLENGTVKPHIDRIFPWADAEKALQYMQERLHLGKILLEVASK